MKIAGGSGFKDNYSLVATILKNSDNGFKVQRYNMFYSRFAFYPELGR